MYPCREYKGRMTTITPELPIELVTRFLGMKTLDRNYDDISSGVR